jgi:GNAT superfamily N-acetyltransferase
MQIRRRRAKDLGACARLLHVVFYQDHYPAAWPDAPRAWLDDASVMAAWVAEELGEILGHVAISRVENDPRSAIRWQEVTGHEVVELACVSRFYVRPRVRREGIGTALLDVAAGEAAARGLMPVLDAPSPDPRRFGLLESRGWRRVDEQPLDGPSVDGRPVDGRDLHLSLYRYASPRAAVGASFGS